MRLFVMSFVLPERVLIRIIIRYFQHPDRQFRKGEWTAGDAKSKRRKKKIWATCWRIIKQLTDRRDWFAMGEDGRIAPNCCSPFLFFLSFFFFSTLSHGLFFILPFACRYCFLVCFYVVHGESTPKRGRGDDEIDGDGGCGW